MFLHGELAGCVVAFVDITERKRIEEELRQTEKLSALGKMSAGLAHELNNPAAAAQRAALQIGEQLKELETVSIRLSQQGLDGEFWTRLHRACHQETSQGATADLSPLERADREDAAAFWLADHGMEDSWQIAPGLVALGLDEKSLDAVAGSLPGDAVADALRWTSLSQAVSELSHTIASSASAISDLVAAVKEYSYMDRAPEQEVDIHEGIESTLRILNHKIRYGTRLIREFDRGLPRVVVRGGELNQVWTNLIDNAMVPPDRRAKFASGPSGRETASWLRLRTMGREFRRNCGLGYSTPSSPPRNRDRAPGWGLYQF